MGERTGREPSRASAGPGGEEPDGDDPASAQAGGSTPGHAPRPPGHAPVFLSELAGPDLVIVSATRGAGMALAGRDASLVGCRVADVVQGPGAQRLIGTLQEVRVTGRHARNVLWRARAAGGTEEAGRSAFSVSAVPVRRSDGPADGVVIAGLGMTSLPARIPGPGRTAGAAPAPGPPGPGAAQDGATPPGLPVLPGVRLAAADWSMEFPADPQALTGLRAGLRDWLADMGADPAGRADVELAVWEAAVNAAVHGRPSQGPGRVTVQAGLDSTGNVLIQVTDQGRWQLGDTPGSGQRWAGGRGLSVISQVTDEVCIAPSPAGTTVVMRRRVHHPVSARPAAR